MPGLVGGAPAGEVTEVVAGRQHDQGLSYPARVWLPGAQEEQEMIYPSEGQVDREGIWSGEEGEDRALHHFPGVTAGWDLLIPTSKSSNTDSSKQQNSKVVRRRRKKEFSLP